MNGKHGHALKKRGFSGRFVAAMETGITPALALKTIRPPVGGDGVISLPPPIDRYGATGS
jgi:hypothetical protein